MERIELMPRLDNKKRLPWEINDRPKGNYTKDKDLLKWYWGPWRRLRKNFWIHECERQGIGHALCVSCEKKGRITLATDVDHITPISKGGDKEDFDNMQALCKSCHAKKSRTERG